MKIDPTTGLPVAETPEEEKALKVYATSLAATTPPITGLPGDIKTGKQLLIEAGGSEIDWPARYNGLAGAMLQQRKAYETQIGELDAAHKKAAADVVARDTQLTALHPLADGAAALQQLLDTEKVARVAAEDKVTKQQLLFKFPGLLKTGPNGEENPLVAVLMSTNLPIADLEAKAKLLSESFAPIIPAPAGGVGSTMPPASGDGNDIAGWRVKAKDAQGRMKAAKTETERATAEVEWNAAWTKVRELEKK
jgi:hypothetical protein